MNPSEIFRSVYSVSAWLCGGSALAVAIWSLASPIDDSIPTASSELEILSAKFPPSQPSALPLAERSQVIVDEVWQRQLQKPRSSVVPAKMTPESTVGTQASNSSASGLGIRLVGTMVEPGFCFATFSDRNGRMDTRKVGQELGLEPSGVRVKTVGRSQVRIVYQGREEVLRIGQELRSNLNSADEQFSREVNNSPSEFDSLEDELEWMNGEVDATGSMQSLPAAGEEGAAANRGENERADVEVLREKPGGGQ